MKTDNWRVAGVEEPVTVPIRTFQSLHVRKHRTQQTESIKSFCVRYEPLGKVTETTTAAT